MQQRIVTVTAAALLAIGVVAAPAFAQYPPEPGPVTVADVTVATPGATILIEGRDWGPDTTIEIIYEDGQGQQATVATTRSDHVGAFAAEVTVPADASPGEARLTAQATAPGGTVQAGSPLSITLVEHDAAIAGGPPGMGDGEAAAAGVGAPVTVGGAVALALGLLAAGMLVAGWLRRRAGAG